MQDSRDPVPGTPPLEFRWILALFVALATAYAIVTPPFRAPDERNHLLRAYGISEGRLLPYRISSTLAGDQLPASLSRLSEALGHHSDMRIAPQQLAAAYALELQPAEIEVAEFSTAIYSPLAYVPAACAIAVARVAGVRPLGLLYAARAANVLAGSALLALAVSLAAFARPATFFVAALPMTLFQVGSASADAVSFGISFLWISLVVALAVREEPPRRALPVFLVVLALCLSQLRPPYPLLVLLIFLVPARRWQPRRGGARLVCAVVIAAAIIPAILWNAAVVHLQVSPDIGGIVAPIQQARWIAEHPGGFVAMLGIEIYQRTVWYWRQAVGILGWLNVPLPSAVYPAAFLTFLLAICSAGSGSMLGLWRRLALFGAAGAGFVAIHVVLYATFNPVGSPRIEGVQGRYLLPLLLLVGVAFSSARLRHRCSLCIAHVVILGFAAAANTAALVVLAHAAGPP